MTCLYTDKAKLEKGQFKLRARRINWELVTKPEIIALGNLWVRNLNSINSPFCIFKINDSMTHNLETIQFNVSPNSLGINRPKKGYVANHLYESGCGLVFSQSMLGQVSIIIYPFKSELCEMTKKQIVLHCDLEPNQVTKKVIENAFQNMLFYARISSQHGMSYGISVKDNIKLGLLYSRDIRSRVRRREVLLTLDNEWLKILMAASVAAVITLLVSWFTKI
ncbi:hypothetical protein VSVS12_04009 [Vibrio scophthalmi]|uniref:hypothetical protein n=1 Tax=Vibrio scophthalmi TaxID=45658 RepID=UPI0008091A56|nr:hypothetical protein [Vibrio scophthalmi]ANS87709.1 hypothetical protein VSVS12_04009 [Vibrio scophthalmi]